jgi:oxygen-independent coproporphyrinogen-3 oxidase
LATEKLSAAGYIQYEISNWARKSSSTSEISGLNSTLTLACRHNLQYWRNLPYLGFGAGAHGFVDGVRISNVLTPKAYIQRLVELSTLPAFPRTPATISVQSIDKKTEMSETMMMGLRLTQEGVSRSVFQARFDEDLSRVYAASIKKFIDLQLLEWAGEDCDVLRLSPEGYLLGNQVFSEFL